MTPALNQTILGSDDGLGTPRICEINAISAFSAYLSVIKYCWNLFVCHPGSISKPPKTMYRVNGFTEILEIPRNFQAVPGPAGKEV
jgi:hypothetical protein